VTSSDNSFESIYTSIGGDWVLNRKAAIFTHPSLWPYLASGKNSWWYLKRFNSYRVDKQANRHTHTHTFLKTIPPSPRCRCASGNKDEYIMCSTAHCVLTCRLPACRSIICRVYTTCRGRRGRKQRLCMSRHPAVTWSTHRPVDRNRK